MGGFVHIGWDYYVYVGAVADVAGIVPAVQGLGLYVESGRSSPDVDLVDALLSQRAGHGAGPTAPKIAAFTSNGVRGLPIPFTHPGAGVTTGHIHVRSPLVFAVNASNSGAATSDVIYPANLSGQRVGYRQLMASDRHSNKVAVAAVVALVAGATLVLLLQVIPPTNEISALDTTLSEYGTGTNKWIFNLALILLATGSVAGLAVLLRQGRLPVPAAALGAVWSVGLLVILAFAKHDWRIDPTMDAAGMAHRAASIVAFVCLPLAVLASARRAFPYAPRRRLTARLLAMASFGWLAVIVSAIVVAIHTGHDWWLSTPYGLEERGLALTELLALAVLILPVGNRLARVRPAARARGGPRPHHLGTREGRSAR